MQRFVNLFKMRLIVYIIAKYICVRLRFLPYNKKYNSRDEFAQMCIFTRIEMW